MEKKHRILLIGNVNGAYRSQTLIKGLLDRGYLVSHVSRGYYLAPIEGPEGDRTQIGRIRRGLWLRLSRYLMAVEVFIKALFADVLYLLPMNGDDIGVAVRVKRLLRKPLVSELYISLYDTEVRDRARVAASSPEAKWFLACDRKILKESDVVVHIARHELDYIADLVGVKLSSAKVAVLPLAVEPKRLAEPPRETPTPFRLCWWGSFIPLHGIDHVLAAAQLLHQQGFPFTLHMFGVPGVELERYQEAIRAMDLGEVVTLSWKETFANGRLEELLTANCDLALGIFGTTEKAMHTVPNKLVDALAMRLPTLTMMSPSLSEFLDVERELFTCNSDPVSIAEAIINVAGLPTEARTSRADAGYRRYLATFTPQFYLEGVETVLARLIRSGG